MPFARQSAERLLVGMRPESAILLKCSSIVLIADDAGPSIIGFFENRRGSTRARRPLTYKAGDDLF